MYMRRMYAVMDLAYTNIATGDDPDKTGVIDNLSSRVPADRAPIICSRQCCSYVRIPVHNLVNNGLIAATCGRQR